MGWRGTYGDKLLCEELTNRGITLHGAITAFGENLGSKGNVRNFDLSTDSRFVLLQKVKGASPEEMRALADYLASRFAQSQVIAKPLPCSTRGLRSGRKRKRAWRFAQGFAISVGGLFS